MTYGIAVLAPTLEGAQTFLKALGFNPIRRLNSPAAADPDEEGLSEFVMEAADPFDEEKYSFLGPMVADYCPISSELDVAVHDAAKSYPLIVLLDASAEYFLLKKA